jgi:hypothetical protein
VPHDRDRPHDNLAGQRQWLGFGTLQVRRVLLRRNIAIYAETAQLVAGAVQAALQPPLSPGHHADAREAPPPAASRCSDLDLVAAAAGSFGLMTHSLTA